MNAKTCKRLRRTVRQIAKPGIPERSYARDHTGATRLIQQCTRAAYLALKKLKRLGHEIDPSPESLNPPKAA